MHSKTVNTNARSMNKQKANRYDAVILTDFNPGRPWLHHRALGAYHISNILRAQGLQVFNLDFLFSFSQAEVELIARKVISSATKFIGLSTTFMTSYYGSENESPNYNKLALLQFLTTAKQINPRIQVIKGGGFSYYREPNIDHYIEGQYVENKFFELLNSDLGFSLNPNYQFISHDMQFDDLDFIVPGEALPLEVSRGCVFNCKFCGFSGRGKKRNDNIKRSNLIRDFLFQSNKKFGTEHFFLADDTFNESMEKLTEFHEIVESLPYQPKFSAYIRLELLMAFPEMLPLLKKIGVHAMTFGIETFHRKAALAIGKSLDSQKIKDYLLFLKTEHPDIHTSSGFIAGLPFENAESCRETNQWLIENKALHFWQFYPLFLENLGQNQYSSEFSKNIEKYNYIRQDRMGWKRDDWSFEGAHDLCLTLNSENKKHLKVSSWYLFTWPRKGELENARQLLETEFEKQCTTEKFETYKKMIFQFIQSL